MRRVVPTLAVLLAALPRGAAAGDLAGQQLLVTSVRTGDTQVFAVDPDTGDAQNLTRCPKSDNRYPAWSSDGARIAFTSNRDGAFNLYVMDADGKNVKRLTDEKAPAVCYLPSWTGDGKRIVFGLQTDKAQIAAVAPDGTGFQVLGEGHDPCVSPDGKAVVFTRKVKKGFCLFAVDADGGNERRLTTHENEMGAVHPVWSPDGAKVLYSDQVGDALEIFVCDADGKNVKQLTALGKVSTSPAWSPDGKWVSFRVAATAFWRDPRELEKAYKDKPGDKRPVYVMKADGSEVQLVEPLHYQCGLDGSRAAWKPR